MYRQTALVAAAVLALPAAGGADPLSVFAPTQVRAISVTPADARALRGLPPLEAFGRLLGTRSPGLDEVGSAREAAAEAGFTPRLPATVPAQFGHAVRYEVTQRAHTTFTFDGRKARAWAAAQKVALLPLPSGLDGATYSAVLAPVSIVTYGTPSARGGRGERGVRRGNFLTVVQAPLPTITSSGPPLSVLADWFSRQPGVPPHLAAQVRAIGDPAQTLPIPVRFDKQNAAPIDVDGVRGLALGDESGIGSAIVWTKGGTLYAVGGTLAQSALVTIANGLRG